MAGDLNLFEPVFILKADEMRFLLRNLPDSEEKELIFKVLKRGYMKMPDLKIYPSF